MQIFYAFLFFYFSEVQKKKIRSHRSQKCLLTQQINDSFSGLNAVLKHNRVCWLTIQWTNKEV